MTKSSNINNNQQGYDIWSAFYDQYPNPTVAMDENHFPDFWRHHCAKKVLEIGCGTGRHTQKLSAANNLVTALDPSPGMLSVAKEKIKADNVEFILGDFLSLQLKEFNYDVIVEALVLEHIADLNKFFLKASAHLKTSGDFYLSEIHPERTAQGVLAHFKSPEGDEDIHLVSYAHTEEDVLRGAKSAGFKLLNEKNILGDQRLAEAHSKWAKHLGKPMIKIWHFTK